MPVTRERIQYPNFDSAEFNVDLPVGGYPIRRTGPMEFRRLSPFNAPEDVNIEVKYSVDAINILFAYPNDEPGERAERAIDEYYQRRVLLGKHTRKILRLTVGAHACELLQGTEELLSRQQSRAWLEGLPETAYFACVRNCEVVSEILRQLPLKVKRQIVNIIQRNHPESDPVADLSPAP